MRPPRHPPQQKEPGDREHVGRGVKQPVAEGVRLQAIYGCGRVFGDVADHVVPLQDLVQHDPVKEPTQS